jgi:3-isopropylmalate dehydratase
MSPAMAAAAAVSGAISDVRKFPYLGTEIEDPRFIPKESRSNVFSTESYVSPGAVISPPAPYQEGGGLASSGEKAGLPKFTVLSGVATPLDIQNIDTDMIIPKEIPKTIQCAGLLRY